MSPRPTTPPPKPYTNMKASFPEVAEAYERLGDALHAAGPLSPALRELVKLGMTIGVAHESGTKAHARLALEAGASPEEIRHAALLAVTTLGWPAMMRGMTWVEDVLQSRK
jgi:4-carboxymuconolactone decarboxylase